MTALKPIENRRVRAVASERYPLNKKCAHPDCNEPAVDPHHAFPRSAIGGDSWFVEVTLTSPEDMDSDWTVTIPHVTGLCRAHHDEVELHGAWIKLDWPKASEPGVWNWYDRYEATDIVLEGGGLRPIDPPEVEWGLVGPLNPQPGSVEGKPKRKRFKGEARRKRKTISLRVPDDADEDGAALYDEAVEQLEERLNPENHRPAYYTIMDALNYTILNVTDDDIGGSE